MKKWRIVIVVFITQLSFAGTPSFGDLVYRKVMAHEIKSLVFRDHFFLPDQPEGQVCVFIHRNSEYVATARFNDHGMEKVKVADFVASAWFSVSEIRPAHREKDDIVKFSDEVLAQVEAGKRANPCFRIDKGRSYRVIGALAPTKEENVLVELIDDRTSVSVFFPVSYLDLSDIRL